MARPIWGVHLDFDSETELDPTGDGGWRGEIAEGWETPRGPLGGYVMAIEMRGMEVAVDDPERQARSVTSTSCGYPRRDP